MSRSRRAFIGKSGAAVNGTWRLHIDDDTGGDGSTLQCWSVSISQDESAIVQPLTALRAASIVGNQVTLRWVAPFVGPAPTNYVLEGGVAPVTRWPASPTGSKYPIFTFTAPTSLLLSKTRP